MANTKISGATAITSMSNTDEMPVASSGASKKITWANIKASLVGALSLDNLSDAAVSGAAAGQSLIHDGTNFINASVPLANIVAPSGAILESYPRQYGMGATATLTSGTLYMNGVWLPKGVTISSITFYASTGITSPTNQFFALYDDSSGTSSGTARALLRATANDTTTAWATSAFKTLNLTSSYQTTRSGLFYVGIMTTGGSNLVCGALQSTNTNVTGRTPIIFGSSNTGLTTALPDPGSAITAVQAYPYFYLS